MDENTTTPTIEALAARVAALEFQVQKLDRLVYKLFEQRKRAVMETASNGASAR
jgi:hypothetical protein